MPIFARTKLVLQDDCFDFVNPDMSLSYTGPNPQKAYKKIKEMFRTVFGTKEGERVQESEYNWNREGGKEVFNAKWEIAKDMDKFSYLVFRVKLKGYVDVKTKQGKASVSVDGVTRTEYPQDTFWERSIFYELIRVFWHKIFYHEKRLNYQDDCRNIMSVFTNELKHFFNLLPERI